MVNNGPRMEFSDLIFEQARGRLFELGVNTLELAPRVMRTPFSWKFDLGTYDTAHPPPPAEINGYDINWLPVILERLGGIAIEQPKSNDLVFLAVVKRTISELDARSTVVEIPETDLLHERPEFTDLDLVAKIWPGEPLSWVARKRLGIRKISSDSVAEETILFGHQIVGSRGARISLQRIYEGRRDRIRRAARKAVQDVGSA